MVNYADENKELITELKELIKTVEGTLSTFGTHTTEHIKKASMFSVVVRSKTALNNPEYRGGLSKSIKELKEIVK
jgi:hypothetical protein